MVCFPNYDAMELAYGVWGEEQLEEGKVFFHNRRMFREFSDKNQQYRIMQDYKKEVNEGRGAVLLIVFRATFAEGYNFKDDLCRAMVVVGQPWTSLGDSKLILKG